VKKVRQLQLFVPYVKEPKIIQLNPMSVNEGLKRGFLTWYKIHAPEEIFTSIGYKMCYYKLKSLYFSEAQCA
jgi:hypothetical protein